MGPQRDQHPKWKFGDSPSIATSGGSPSTILRRRPFGGNYFCRFTVLHIKHGPVAGNTCIDVR